MAKKKRTPKKAGDPEAGRSGPQGFVPSARGAIEGMTRNLASGRGKAHRSPLAMAQEIADAAWEAARPQDQAALAQHALSVSADCADAYVILANQAPSRQKARELLEEGVAAGARAIGKENFESAAGHFWLDQRTRPYMRARLGLAQCLWESGQRSEAAEHYTEMLRLNPNDNQGVRYLLLGALVELDRDADAQRLLQRYRKRFLRRMGLHQRLAGLPPRRRFARLPRPAAGGRRRPTVRARVPGGQPAHAAGAADVRQPRRRGRGGKLRGPVPPHLAELARRDPLAAKDAPACPCRSRPSPASRSGRSSAMPSCGCRKSKARSGNSMSAACPAEVNDRRRSEPLPADRASRSPLDAGPLEPHRGRDPRLRGGRHASPPPPRPGTPSSRPSCVRARAMPHRPAEIHVRRKAFFKAWQEKLRQIGHRLPLDERAGRAGPRVGEPAARGSAGCRPSRSRRSRRRSRSRQPGRLAAEIGEVWQADVRHLPGWLEHEGELRRPWASLVTSREEHAVLAQNLSVDPPPPSGSGTTSPTPCCGR